MHASNYKKFFKEPCYYACAWLLQWVDGWFRGLLLNPVKYTCANFKTT